jgi:hypothetical protein
MTGLRGCRAFFGRVSKKNSTVNRQRRHWSQLVINVRAQRTDSIRREHESNRSGFDSVAKPEFLPETFLIRFH